MKIVLIITYLMLCSFSLAASTGAAWLYEVAVPVESQDSVDRERGVKEALGTLLIRIT